MHPDPGDPIPDTSHVAQVSLVMWPEEAAIRRQLVAARRPRLLLVGADQDPPAAADELEDWARFPLDPEELASRTASLADRARGVPPRLVDLRLDPDGVLHTGGRWVALPSREAIVLTELLDKAGHLVTRDVLARAAWPEDPPAGDRALAGAVKRLRRRVAPLGVTISTVHRQGYLLDHVRQPDGRPGR